MPERVLDAVFFIEKPPVIAYRDGMFHVCYDIGRTASFEVVMSPRTFVQARLGGAEACAHWQLGTMPEDDKIVSIGGGKH